MNKKITFWWFDDRWFGDWEAYAGYPPDGQHVIRAENSSCKRPGIIDNADILDKAAVDKLLPDLQEGRDFKLLSEDAWKYLHDLYGGGPVITRRVVIAKGRPVVEVYQMTLQVKRSSDPSQVIAISVSQEVTPLPTQSSSFSQVEVHPVLCYLFSGTIERLSVKVCAVNLC